MMGDLVTNEHFVPEPGVTIADYLERGHKTAVHHLIRYEWAKTVLMDARPKSVLDVACGSGYGSHSLAAALPNCKVVGGDYDPVAVEFARETHCAANLSFVEADMTRWEESLGDALYDCVVSFDTLEHIGHREIAMQHLVEHLNPTGVLLFSTPVKSRNILNPGWEHHKIEFSHVALYDFLCRYFREVLAPDHGTLPHVDVFEQVNGGVDQPTYLLRMNPLVCRDPIRVRR